MCHKLISLLFWVCVSVCVYFAVKVKRFRLDIYPFNIYVCTTGLGAELGLTINSSVTSFFFNENILHRLTTNIKLTAVIEDQIRLVS